MLIKETVINQNQTLRLIANAMPENDPNEGALFNGILFVPAVRSLINQVKITVYQVNFS
jgi:hypothetical protein